MRALVALAVALPALVPSPAGAAPPYSVTGDGTVSPGLSIAAAPQSFAFSGTATDALGMTSPCVFSGWVDGTVSGSVGTASGTCAGVPYPTCLTTLSVTQWTLACMPAGAGSFVVTPNSPTLMTTFQATGTFT